MYTILGLKYVADQPEIDFSARMSRTKFSSFFEIAGIASYSIEGIGLLFALRYDYLRHNSYRQFRRSYFGILLFTVVLYMFFTVSNYLKFYDETGPIIFYNYSYHETFPFVLEVCYLVVR